MLRRQRRAEYGRLTQPIASGVNFIGYWHMRSGLGAAARGNLKVMREVGPVLPAPFPGVDQVIGNPYTVNFHHWHPESPLLEGIRRNPVDVFCGRRNIGFWVCETTTVADSWKRNSECFDEVWTASRFCQTVLERNGIQCPVKVLPHAITGTVKKSVRERLNCLAGLRFLTVYDSHSRVSRKNPFGVVWAFRAAFPKDEPVALTVKLRNSCPGEADLLRAAAGGDRRIEVIDCEYSVEQMAELYATSHVFVSLHRGEGFGLHIAEAMISGMLVILSGCGGCLDFARRDRSLWVAVRDAAVYDSYFPGGSWWEPDQGHASAIMRRAWEEYGTDETGAMLAAAAAVEEDLSLSRISGIATSLLSGHL